MPRQQRRAHLARSRYLCMGCLLVAFVAGPASAAQPLSFAGNLAGVVVDTSGIPQMGAAIQLYNRFDRLLGRALTSQDGSFRFSSLMPDVYSVRVSLASFVPALKRNVAVQAGGESFLTIQLSSLLSSVELVYMAPGTRAIMSEDWKWVLRSASATRPVLRILPGVDISDPTRGMGRTASVFSDTHGMVRLSAGEGGALSAAGNQTDLGTAFALATSLFGSNQLQFSGNLGYASNAGIPAAGFRTRYSRARDHGASPEVNLTMRQMFLPARAGLAFLGGTQQGFPALQTVTITTLDRQQLTEGLELEYGGTLESVSFLRRLNYVSPFARARWELGGLGFLEFGFSSGAPPIELIASEDPSEAELQQDLAVLSLFPRVSLRRGHARVQRTQNIELGFRRAAGSRTYAISAYREGVTNAAFLLASPAGYYSSSDLLPDLGSASSVFNAGNYRRAGLLLSVAQSLGPDLQAAIGYGYDGGLSPTGLLTTNEPSEVRNLLRSSMRHSLSARLAGVVPLSGTRFITGYQWANYRVFSPAHFSLIRRAFHEPGLNLYVRQPLPRAGFFSGRFEATAELRNLLAQGYLPIYTLDGRKIVLIHAPRAVRGGLSFIF